MCQDQTTSTPGEAVLTAASDFAAQAKLSREQIRSQNKADLQAIINNQDLGDDQKQEAVSTMVSDGGSDGKRVGSRTSSGSQRLRKCDCKPYRRNGRCGGSGSRSGQMQNGLRLKTL